MLSIFGQLLSKFEGKTYIAGLSMLGAAYLKYDAGDLQGAFELGSTGLGILGIGNKIEKASTAEDER